MARNQSVPRLFLFISSTFMLSFLHFPQAGNHTLRCAISLLKWVLQFACDCFRGVPIKLVNPLEDTLPRDYDCCTLE